MNLIDSFAHIGKAWTLFVFIAMTTSCGENSEDPKDGGSNQIPLDSSVEATALPDAGGGAVDAAKTEAGGDIALDARLGDATDVTDTRRTDGATCPGTGTACELCGLAKCCAEYSICAMDATCMRGLRDFSACHADAADGTACIEAFAKVSRVAENYAGCLVDSCDVPCRIQH